MSTHNKRFHGEIRKIFDWYPFLTRAVWEVQTCNVWTQNLLFLFLHKSMHCCEMNLWESQNIFSWRVKKKTQKNNNKNNKNKKHLIYFTPENQGPVVQSDVSLTNSLVVKMLTVLVSTISNSQLFFCWKNVSSFCKCKSYSHFFSKNVSVLCHI